MPLLMPLMTLLLTTLIGCADPAADKSHAAVSEKAAAPATPAAPKEAAPATPAAPAPAANPNVKILTPSGQIGFTGAKITKSHPGSFDTWKGEFAVDGDTLAGIMFEVQTTSVRTDSPKLDEHLRSADFFDAAQFPTSKFQSTKITAGAPADSKLAGATHTVEGELTLHGVTKVISFPAVIDVSAAEIKARTEFVISRKDFGIVYPGKPDDLIKEEVVLRAGMVAKR